MYKNNYKALEVVAKRITRRRDVSMFTDLLSETYINLYEKKTTFPTINDEFVKFFSKCMKNYFVWPNSSFNKVHELEINIITRNNAYAKDYYHKETGEITYSTKGEDNFRGELDTNPTGIEGIIDEDALHDIEIQVEGTNDFTKEIIEISSNLGKSKTLKFIELVEFKRTLPDHEMVLFELYFEKELSTREIANEYSGDGHYINYQSVNKMINHIKNKINNYSWKS